MQAYNYKRIKEMSRSQSFYRQSSIFGSRIVDAVKRL